MLPPADGRTGSLRGAVTSADHSPVLDVGIGWGYLSPESRQDGPVELEMRGAWRTVKQVDPPLLKK